MSITLAALPYAMNALAPVISEETLQYHYGKHHKAYVDKLNSLIAGTTMDNQSLEDIILNSQGAIFNNAAQVWNHTFYWHCLSPKKGLHPSPALQKAIEASFGSLEQFQQQFSDTAMNTFGSGWAWLVRDESGSLKLVSTSNAQTPLTDKNLKPLLTVDVWEHAYYIDYRNARANYLSQFWQIINWDFVSQNFEG